MMPEQRPRCPQIMKHYARLLLAFHLCRPDICRGDEELLADLLHHLDKPRDHDIRVFVPLLTSQLAIKDKTLFSSPVPVKYDEPILIESDDALLNQDIDSDHLKHERPQCWKSKIWHTSQFALVRRTELLDARLIVCPMAFTECGTSATLRDLEVPRLTVKTTSNPTSPSLVRSQAARYSECPTKRRCPLEGSVNSSQRGSATPHKGYNGMEAVRCSGLDAQVS
jgi:hypothetical protein